MLGPALRLHDLVWGYDCAFSAASEAERQAIVDEILAYLAALCTDPDFLVFGFNPLVSNKSVTLGAQLVLASLLLAKDLPGEPLVAQARATGDVLLAKAWRDLFGADGSYREGVTYAVLVDAHAPAHLGGPAAPRRRGGLGGRRARRR